MPFKRMTYNRFERDKFVIHTALVNKITFPNGYEYHTLKKADDIRTSNLYHDGRAYLWVTEKYVHYFWCHLEKDITKFTKLLRNGVKPRKAMEFMML